MILFLSHQSAILAFKTFFAFVKAMFVTLVLIVIVLVAGQSTVAPVSFNLLTTYAMEYAVSQFKPYRHFFPEPYLLDLDTK